MGSYGVTSRLKRLTPHQREVLDRLRRLSERMRRAERGRYAWVPLHYIGSKGALDRLVGKGRVERMYQHGPRGGVHYSYRPTGGKS